MQGNCGLNEDCILRYINWFIYKPTKWRAILFQQVAVLRIVDYVHCCDSWDDRRDDEHSVSPHRRTEQEPKLIDRQHQIKLSCQGHRAMGTLQWLNVMTHESCERVRNSRWMISSDKLDKWAIYQCAIVSLSYSAYLWSQRTSNTGWHDLIQRMECTACKIMYNRVVSLSLSTKQIRLALFSIAWSRIRSICIPQGWVVAHLLSGQHKQQQHGLLFEEMGDGDHAVQVNKLN